ncbi:hypothetical protein HW560_19705 [Paenibacillus sp. E222]|uniref:hypothetical protein n=1 Tax=Paenibacillus sp. E222 TaxID=2748863 RepID=UPI0015C5B5C1|nr:hypothetical protein [Paenibacillus sp. E222]QLG40115.1 hypothetical protein HW560_19705 [Paenibacillus sp. E222]
MNYSFKFRNVALSALLLTAISAPIVANADSAANANAVTNGTATLKEAKSAIAAFTLANPVELAKKYAPETVSEWKKTLARYNKLLSQNSISQVMATLVAVDVDSDEWKKVSENAKPGEIKEMQALKVEEGKLTLVEGVKAEKTTGTTSAVIADAQSLQFSGTTAASAFFSAQANLNKAVTAKDEAAIKTSLADLLKQYKAQIAELEAAQE